MEELIGETLDEEIKREDVPAEVLFDAIAMAEKNERLGRRIWQRRLC